MLVNEMLQEDHWTVCLNQFENCNVKEKTEFVVTFCFIDFFLRKVYEILFIRCKNMCFSASLLFY